MYKRIQIACLLLMVLVCASLQASGRQYRLSSIRDNAEIMHTTKSDNEVRKHILILALKSDEASFPPMIESEIVMKRRYKNNLLDALKSASNRYKQYAQYKHSYNYESARKHALYHTLQDPFAGDCCSSSSDMSLYDCFCCWSTPSNYRILCSLDRDIDYLKQLVDHELEDAII